MKKYNRIKSEAEDMIKRLEKRIIIAKQNKDFETAEQLIKSQLRLKIKLRKTNEAVKHYRFLTADFEQIDKATKETESPEAELSRLLTENYEITSSFGSINSEEIANLIGRKLSTPKIHKAILKNFDGIKFRKQNGGFTYTLRRRNTVNFND